MSVISAIRGDTTEYAIALTNAAGAPLDLTAKELTFTVKRHSYDDDADAVLVRTAADGIEVDAGTGGTATISLTAEETADLEPRTYHWDVQVEDGDDVRTPLRGLLSVVADITRTTSAVGS